MVELKSVHKYDSVFYVLEMLNINYNNVKCTLDASCCQL